MVAPAFPARRPARCHGPERVSACSRRGTSVRPRPLASSPAAIGCPALLGLEGRPAGVPAYFCVRRATLVGAAGRFIQAHLPPRAVTAASHHRRCLLPRPQRRRRRQPVPAYRPRPARFPQGALCNARRCPPACPPATPPALPLPSRLPCFTPACPWPPQVTCHSSIRSAPHNTPAASSFGRMPSNSLHPLHQHAAPCRCEQHSSVTCPTQHAVRPNPLSVHRRSAPVGTLEASRPWLVIRPVRAPPLPQPLCSRIHRITPQAPASTDAPPKRHEARRIKCGIQ